MSICRDLKLDDVKDINVSMKGSPLDVLAAVAARGKEILDEHLHAMEAKRLATGKGIFIEEEPLPAALDSTTKTTINQDGEASTSTGKETKRVTHDGEASASTSKPKKRKCNPNFRPPLPERFDKLIREMARGKNLTPPTLVIQKQLFGTDVSHGHNRFSIPVSMIRDDFLTEEEKQHVRARDLVTRKKKFIEATIIEPSLATETVKFRQWDMAKPNGGRTSSIYVINESWKEIVKRNNLIEYMEVQLWCFRLDQYLCFALVPL